MDTMTVVVVAVFVCTIIAAVWLNTWSARQQRELKRAWARALAEKVGGVVVSTSDDRNPWIRFEVAGREAEFYFQGGEDDDRTTVDVSITGLSPGALTVTAGAWPRFLRRLLRLHKLELGASWFDERYTVRATPETLARQVLDGGALERIRQLERFGPPIVELTRDRFSIGVARRIEDVAILSVLVRCAEPFVAALSIQVKGGPWSLGGRCPVCASELADDVLLCKRCRTPVHADCWRYIGRCAVYGCRETRT